MARVSVYIGGIRPLARSGRPSGIHKAPPAGPIELNEEGFAGDRQADRRVHGGPDKAVHLYPARHYHRLAERFPEAAQCLRPGSIGENLSTDEIDEGDVRIGDVWRLGSARLQPTQPRSPCWKIDERFDCDGMAAFIDENLLTGWYWRVLEAGVVAPRDTLELVQPATHAPTLRESMQLWREHRPDLDRLDHLARLPGLAAAWRARIEQRLSWLKKAAG